jgi:hypothetical protein
VVVDNFDLGPHTVVPSHRVTADDPFSCAGRRHMCPPFHYSDTGNKVVVLQILKSANCTIIIESMLEGTVIKFAKPKENTAQ